MKRLFIILPVLLFCLSNQGQAQRANISGLFTTAEDKGDQMFHDLYFEKAIEFYRIALKKDEQNRYLRLKVARSYRELRQYQQAANWYDSALHQMDSIGTPDDYLNFAETLLSTGQYQKAIQWFDKYIESAGDDKNTKEKIEAIQRKRYFMRDSVLYSVRNLFINTQFSEFGARYHDRGIVYLTSSGRDPLIDHDLYREENLFDLYYAPASRNYHGDPSPFDKTVNSKYHEGPVAFFKEGDKMVLTRNNYVGNKRIEAPDGQTKLQLFFTTMQDGKWQKPVSFQHNDPTYSLAHPALSGTNDTLFYVSDMPGGIGGTDIYYSVRSGESWSSPVNLGAGINTEGNELFPYMIDDRLYFSSDGYGGMGGLDIYRTKIKDGDFQKPVNLGYPVNTIQDDYGYIFNREERTGYITSNRYGGRGGDDLYKVTSNALLLNGVAMDIEDRIPIDAAFISLNDAAGNQLQNVLSSPQGDFHFYLPYDEQFSLTGEKTDYTLDHVTILDTHGNPLDLDTAYVWFWRHKLFAEGRIFSNELQALMPDVLVTIENLTDGTIDSVRTGEDGKYRFVVRPDKQYRIRAEKPGHLPDGFELNTAGMDEGVLLNDIVLEEEYLDKDVIFFDFDKSNVKPESYSALNNLVRIMKERPQTWIVIGAHADSRGTFEYNQNLAERRARSTVKYLTDRGISRARIVDHAFGEELLLNRCSDGVDCPEEEHSKNRRAELKIQRD